jgi:acylphosphatase
LSTIRATVRGRVQGVSYRNFALLEARRLGVTGFVRNPVNHNEVEVVATAGAAQLETYLVRLRRGPPAAQVRNVTVEWSDRETVFADFAIRY